MARLTRLCELTERGWDDERIGAALGCSAVAVGLARKRHRLPSRDRLCLTARRVARLLGVGDGKTITRWIAAGWLRARRGWREARCRVWVIAWGDLERFLADPAHWQRWDPARITDPALARHAAAVRGGLRYLTHAEVAQIAGVVRGTVNSWIAKGWLPAQRNGNWFVREDHLREFLSNWRWGDGWLGGSTPAEMTAIRTRLSEARREAA